MKLIHLHHIYGKNKQEAFSILFWYSIVLKIGENLDTQTEMDKVHLRDSGAADEYRSGFLDSTLQIGLGK